MMANKAEVATQTNVVKPKARRPIKPTSKYAPTTKAKIVESELWNLRIDRSHEDHGQC